MKINKFSQNKKFQKKYKKEKKMNKGKIDSMLTALHAQLKDFKPKNDSVNLFTALGLESIEKHHSTFFAGLLNPNNPHGFGDFALKKFLDYLWNDDVRKYEIKKGRSAIEGNTRPNSDILKTIANSRQELVALVNGKINVQTEVAINQTVDGQKGYMDILVEISDASKPAEYEGDINQEEEDSAAQQKSHENVKTVIVIENKTGSDTHSDQLCKYEYHIDSQYPKTCNKIFVLLSPRGAAPINHGGNELYNDRYCIFSYDEKQKETNQGGVCAIIEDMLTELNTKNIPSKQKTKLKYILEDYREMVNKQILLNDPNTYKKCEKIVKECGVAVNMLEEYLASSTRDKVLDFCQQTLGALPECKGGLCFVTPEMRAVFERASEPFEKKMFHIVLMGEDRFTLRIELETVVQKFTQNALKTKYDGYQNETFSPVQHNVIDRLVDAGLIGKHHKEKSVSVQFPGGLTYFTVLSVDERIAPFDSPATQALLSQRLSVFSQTLQSVYNVINQI